MSRRKGKNDDGEWTSSLSGDFKSNTELRKLTNSPGWVAASHKLTSSKSPSSSRASTPVSTISNSSRKSGTRNAKHEKKKKNSPEKKKFKMVLEKDEDYEIDYVSPDETMEEDSDSDDKEEEESQEEEEEQMSHDEDFSLDEDDLSSVGNDLAWADDQYSDIEADEDAPKLQLPESSLDLLLPNDLILAALGIYEILRHFRSCLRLSPMLFEDFCAALVDEDTNILLTECFMSLLKALLREEDASGVQFGPTDQKDSIHVAFNFLDYMTWPEVTKSYLESSPEFAPGLQALRDPKFPNVGAKEKITILKALTDIYLSSNKIRDKLMSDGVIHYDDHCRVCHKLGDLLCCETCTAVYHLACCDPPLEEVPDDEWQCEVCNAHKLNGVYNCEQQHEFRGQYLRHEPIGTDRHGNKYWFLARRLIVEGQSQIWYYSTLEQFNLLTSMLDPDKYEMVLCEALKDVAEEFPKCAKITQELTEEALPDKITSYLDLLRGRIKREIEEKKKKEELERIRQEEEKRREEEKKRMEEEKKKEEEREMTEEQMAQDEEMTKQSGEKGTEDVLEGSEPGININGISPSADVAAPTSTSSSISSAPEKENVTGTQNNHDGVSDVTDNVSTITSQQTVNTAPPPTTDTSELPSSGESNQNIKTVLNSTQNKNIQVIKLGGGIQVKTPARPLAPASGSLSQLKTLFVLNKDGTKTPIVLGPAGKLLTNNANPQSPANRQILVFNSAKVTTPKVNRELKKLQFMGAGPKMADLAGSKVAENLSYQTRLRTQPQIGSNQVGQSTSSPTVKEEHQTLTPNKESIKYFKLGEDKAYRQYVNHYSENPLALNKYQHKEERDRERYLGYKFSMNGPGEFKWMGDVLGSQAMMIQTLRATLMHLEHQIPLCFMHTRWEKYRKAWGKMVMECNSPQSFAAALGILEMATRGAVKKSIWHDSHGLTRLQRVTTGEKEDFEKRRKHRTRIEEDASNKNAVWCKYPIPVRSSLVWKMKGEEYRMTGYGGWMWVSATRQSQIKPWQPKPHVLVGGDSSCVTPAQSSMKKHSVAEADSESEKSPSTSSTTTTSSVDFTDERNLDVGIVASSKTCVTSTEETKATTDVIDPDSKSATPKSSDCAEAMDVDPNVNDHVDETTSLSQRIINSCDVINVSENLLKRTPLFRKKWTASKVDILLGWRLMQRSATDTTTSSTAAASPSPLSTTSTVTKETNTTTTTINKATDVTMTTNEKASHGKKTLPSAVVPPTAPEAPQSSKSESLPTTDNLGQQGGGGVQEKVGSKPPVQESITDGEAETTKQTEVLHQTSQKHFNCEVREACLGPEVIAKSTESGPASQGGEPAPSEGKPAMQDDSLEPTPQVPEFAKEPDLTPDEVASKEVNDVSNSALVNQEDAPEPTEEMSSRLSDESSTEAPGATDSENLRKEAEDADVDVERNISTEVETNCDTVDVVVEKTTEVSKSRLVTTVETVTTTITKTTSVSRTVMTNEQMKQPVGSTGAMLAKLAEEDRGNKSRVSDRDSTSTDASVAATSGRMTGTELNEAFRAVSESQSLVQQDGGSTASPVSSSAKTGTEATHLSVPEASEVADAPNSLNGALAPSESSKATTVQSVPRTTVVPSTTAVPATQIPSTGGETISVTTTVERSRTRSTRMSRVRRDIRRTPDGGKVSKTQTLWKLQRYRKVSSTVKKEQVMKLPLPWKFCAGRRKKKSIFRLSLPARRKLALSGGLWQYQAGFHYAAKFYSGLELFWTYLCPRPSFHLVWRYKLQNISTFASVAHLLRIFWHAIRWEEMTTRPSTDDVVHTVNTDEAIITTELLKRKDNLMTGLHSEYFIRRITMPILDPEEEALRAIKPGENYTPSRKGLRSSTRPMNLRERPKKELGPQVETIWVPEEQVELWQIRQFDTMLKQQRQASAVSVSPNLTSGPSTFITTPSGAILPTLTQIKGQRPETQPTFNIIKLPMQQTSPLNPSFAAKSFSSPHQSFLSKNTISQLVGKSPVQKIVVQPSSQSMSFPGYKQTDQQQTFIRSTQGGTHYIVQGGKLVKPIVIKAGSQIVTTPLQAKSTHPTIRLNDGSSQLIKFQQQPPPIMPTVKKTQPITPRTPQNQTHKTPNQTQIKLSSSQLSQLMKVGTGTPVRVSVSLGNGRSGVGQIQLIPPGSQVTPAAGQQLMQTRVGGEIKRFLLTLVSETPAPQTAPTQVNEVSLQAASLSQRLQQLQKHTHQAYNKSRSTDMKRLLTDKDPLWGSRPQMAERSLPKKEVERPRKKPLNREEREEVQRSNIVMQVMKSILDRIDRREDAELRKQRREEQLMKQREKKEMSEQAKVLNRQVQILHRHRDHLRQEMLKRRAVVEKYLTHAVKNELREDQRKQRRSSHDGAPAAKRPKKTVNPSVTSTVLTENNAKRPVQSYQQKQKQQNAAKRRRTQSPPPSNRKQQMIHTHAKKNKEVKLYCICRTPYDDTKFYIGCDLCMNWFHGSCVGITESHAKSMNEWVCEDCTRVQEDPSQELYCLCRTPYDESKFYIGCDICQDWYHGSCVGVTEAESESIDFYTCPRCLEKNEKGKVDPAKENRLTRDDYVVLTKIVKSLRSHKMAWPFLQPVSRLEVPHYHKVIKKPMDLGTVMQKMGTYTLLSELVSDVSLIFDNCRQFNGADSPLAKCAEIVESVFVGKMRQYRSTGGRR